VNAFNGAIVGAGEDRTIIRPIEFRALRSTPTPFVDDPSLAQPYPVLLHFASARRVAISKLTIDFPAGMTVSSYDLPFAPGVTNALVAAVLVDSTHDAELLMTKVTIIGTDNDSFFGSNVSAAVRFEGQIREVGGVDETRLLQRAKLVAYDNHIRRSGFGFSVSDANKLDGLILNNEIDVRIYGVFSADLGSSKLGTVHNHIRGEFEGVFVAQDVRPPETPSDYLVAHNEISVNENAGSIGGAVAYDGVGVFDYAGLPESIKANVTIWDNDIRLGDHLVTAGITVSSEGSGNVRVIGNRIRGTPTDSGVYVDLSRGAFVAGNDLRDINPPSGDVHLFPSSHDCSVFEPGDTVLNEGTNNHVIGEIIMSPTATGRASSLAASRQRFSHRVRP
jgi:hypothetical protein